MKKKILTIVLIIIFVLTLILLNNFLNNGEKLEVNQEKKETNKIEDEEENKMEVLKVTNSNFESEVLKSDKPVLIDFYADWCGPCKMLSPIIEEVAKENEDIKVVKINVDSEQELAIEYGVMSIPTVVAIKDGKEIGRRVGVVDKLELINMVK